MPTAWVNPLAAAVDALSTRSVPTRPSRDLEHGDHPRLVVEQGGGGSGGPRRRGQPDDPTGDRGTDRDGVEGGRGQRHQDRQRVTGIGERRGPDLRLASRSGQVGGGGVHHIAHGFQHVVGVGAVVDLDHQSAQSTFDVGAGHAGNFADRIFDYRRVLVPARERQQRVQVQVHSLPALPAHGCRGAVPVAVGRTTGPQ